MSKLTDITGQRYGRLTALKPIGSNKFKKVIWECRCECGQTIRVLGNHLRSGNTASCGCLHREIMKFQFRTHGHSVNGTTTSEYNAWAGMMQRCYNSKHIGFRYYGGRGIHVCNRWFKFENFLADMGRCPPGLTLDRIDPNGDYKRGNCRWVDWYTQRHNRRDSVR